MMLIKEKHIAKNIKKLQYLSVLDSHWLRAPLLEL